MAGLLSNILLSILAFFLPPVVALIKVGCSGHFWLNILLSILAWIPGVIHALWLIWANPST